VSGTECRVPIASSALSAECIWVLKIYCALSAECTPDRAHSALSAECSRASCVVLRNSHQNWQSFTKTVSERWETDLVKEIRRDVKVGGSLSNLIIEIHWIKFRCTHFSSSFQNGLRQHHELIERIQCCIYAFINIARIGRDEYCLFGLWLRCSKWWNQVYQRWLAVNAVSGTRAWIKSTVCLTTAKRRWPIIRIDL